MTTLERRQSILDELCRKRYDTIDSLSATYAVSRSTVRRDILALSCSFPILTVRGRYGGGVYIENWFHLHQKILSPKQVALLRKLLLLLEGDEYVIMCSILEGFAPVEGKTILGK